MDARKIKKFAYIKDGKLLHGEDGFREKLELDTEKLCKEIIDEAFLDEICEMFKAGPLSFKPRFDKLNNTHYEKNQDGFKAAAAGEVKLSIGKNVFAEADYEASISEGASLSHTTGKEKESHAGNSYKYSSGTSNLDASMELRGDIHGHASASAAKYNVKAHYEGNMDFQFNANGSATKMEKERGEHNGHLEGCVKIAEAEGKVGAEGKAHAKLDISGLKELGMDAKLQASAKAEGKCVGLQADGYIHEKECGGKFRVTHAKSKAQADVEMKGKVGNQKLEFKGKASGNTEVTVIEGEGCLGVRKKEKGGYHVDGARIRVGQARAKATADFDFKSNKFGNKNGKASAKATARGANVRALGVDVQAEEEHKKAKTATYIKGVDIKTLNAKVVGKMKGTEVEAKAGIVGVQMNAGNALITGIDETKRVRVVGEAGTSVNVGNIKVTGLGSKGGNCEADVRTGVSAFNVTAGINRETGASVTTENSFGNLDLTLGPRNLRFGIGGGFNIGIPFLGGGGSGSGGGENVQSNNKQAESQHTTDIHHGVSNYRGENYGVDSNQITQGGSCIGSIPGTTAGGDVGTSFEETQTDDNLKFENSYGNHLGGNANGGNATYGSGSGNHATGFQATGCSRNKRNKSNRSHSSKKADYMERIESSVVKKLREDNYADLSQPREESETSRQLEITDKEQLKKHVLEQLKITRNYSEEKTEESVHSRKANKRTESRQKAPAKKPFGEKKNIHTIFTLDGSDTRPLKQITDNVMGFGDE